MFIHRIIKTKLTKGSQDSENNVIPALRIFRFQHMETDSACNYD